MKDFKILISSILIILSFFVWYNFWIEKNKIEISELNNKKYFVDLEIKKWILNISKENDKINVIINWKESNSWAITLK